MFTNNDRILRMLCYAFGPSPPTSCNHSAFQHYLMFYGSQPPLSFSVFEVLIRLPGLQSSSNYQRLVRVRVPMTEKEVKENHNDHCNSGHIVTASVCVGWSIKVFMLEYIFSSTYVLRTPDTIWRCVGGTFLIYSLKVYTVFVSHHGPCLYYQSTSCLSLHVVLLSCFLLCTYSRLFAVLTRS